MESKNKIVMVNSGNCSTYMFRILVIDNSEKRDISNRIVYILCQMKMSCCRG